MKNSVVLLKERPSGPPSNSTFELRERDTPSLRAGEIQVRVELISIDPAMRTWIDDAPSYVPPVKLDDVMRAHAVGTIVASRNPGFEEGDIVEGFFGAQSYYTGPAQLAAKVQCAPEAKQDFLGGLGLTGMAAYFGILNVADVKRDDQVLISAAAGAVGHIAVQIAKLKGARVVGIAGGSHKCKTVTEIYGADACIDYKSENVATQVAALFPNGLDVYFDNVGGDILEAALNNLNFGARIVVCGAIGEYDNLSDVHAPKNYLNLIGAGATMHGLLNRHWMTEYGSARKQMSEWVRDGDLTFSTQVEHGLENFPHALSLLFSGGNVGKLILQI